MKRKYLVLLTVLTALVISCHKDHNKPSNGNGSTVTIPVIATTAVTQITDSSVVSGGSFTTDGDLTITTRGVQWDTAASFPNHWKVSAGSGIGTFQATLSGLMPNTLYYVRAYVGTDTSTYYGNTLNLQPPIPPENISSPPSQAPESPVSPMAIPPSLLSRVPTGSRLTLREISMLQMYTRSERSRQPGSSARWQTSILLLTTWSSIPPGMST